MPAYAGDLNVRLIGVNIPVDALQFYLNQISTLSSFNLLFKGIYIYISKKLVEILMESEDP